MKNDDNRALDARNTETVRQVLDAHQKRIDSLEMRIKTMDNLLKCYSDRNDELQKQLVSMQVHKMGHGPTK